MKFFPTLFILGAIGVNGDTSDDPNYTDMTDLLDYYGDKKATLYYRLDAVDSSLLPSGAVADNDGVNSISMKMVFDGLAWLSVGTSPDGGMIGSEVVLGVPGDYPVKFGPIAGESVQGVMSTMLPGERQTLIDAYIEYINNQTVLAFTKAIAETDETAIVTTGKNVFSFAIGGDQYFPTYHTGGYGSFSLDLSTVSRPSADITIADGTFDYVQDYSNTTVSNQTFEEYTAPDANDTATVQEHTAQDVNDTATTVQEHTGRNTDEPASAQASQTANQSAGLFHKAARVFISCTCVLLSITLL